MATRTHAAVKPFAVGLAGGATGPIAYDCKAAALADVALVDVARARPGADRPP